MDIIYQNPNVINVAQIVKPVHPTHILVIPAIQDIIYLVVHVNHAPMNVVLVLVLPIVIHVNIDIF